MLITVDRYLDPLEAYIVKGRLDAEGIKSYLVHHHHIWAKWTISIALGMIKLQVTDSDLNHARKVIEQIRLGEYESILVETGHKESNSSCPNCHGTNTQRDDFRKRLALFILILFSTPFPYSLAYVRCNHCGYKWKDRDLTSYSTSFMFVIVVITSTAITLGFYIAQGLIEYFLSGLINT